jgi:hypothetical protein
MSEYEIPANIRALHRALAMAREICDQGPEARAMLAAELAKLNKERQARRTPAERLAEAQQIDLLERMFAR